MQLKSTIEIVIEGLNGKALDGEILSKRKYCGACFK
jgi:hypothetical protein